VTPRFIVRPEAEADMAEAYDWYEERSPGLGNDFLAAVDEGLAAVGRPRSASLSFTATPTSRSGVFGCGGSLLGCSSSGTRRARALRA
jgi:hypothetical protein